MPAEHISFDSPFPSELSIDGKDRVTEYLNRHGGAALDVEHESNDCLGESGWSEVHAADGYRLRCEWSEFGIEREMNVVELAPR